MPGEHVVDNRPGFGIKTESNIAKAILPGPTGAVQANASIFNINGQIVDVILDQEVMRDLPSFKDWPTFPQLWVNGELVGGCDIVTEMYRSGELKPLIENFSLDSEEGHKEYPSR